MSQPTKPLSVEEICHKIWQHGQDGNGKDYAYQQAKARLIELVESLPELQSVMHSCKMRDNSDMFNDCLVCVRNKTKKLAREALIKAIKGEQ